MYKYSDNNNDNFSLHDCLATKFIIGDHKLTFEFEEGFWVIKDCPAFSKYTGRSEVSFTTASDNPEQDICVYLVKYLNDRDDSEIRTPMPLDKFAELLSNGTELEFLYEDIEDESYSYLCVLWYPKGTVPRTEECRAVIRAKDITYRWNEVRSDN